MASVQETKQSWSEEDDFQLEKPKLDVQVAFLSVTVVLRSSSDKYLNLL
jgi:hypothetical protein